MFVYQITGQIALVHDVDAIMISIFFFPSTYIHLYFLFLILTSYSKTSHFTMASLLSLLFIANEELSACEPCDT